MSEKIEVRYIERLDTVIRVYVYYEKTVLVNNTPIRHEIMYPCDFVITSGADYSEDELKQAALEKFATFKEAFLDEGLLIEKMRNPEEELRISESLSNQEADSDTEEPVSEP